MNNKIKAAFDPIHASEELKSKTRAFIAQNSCNYTLRKAPYRPRIMPVLAAAACMALAVFAGIKLYFTPTTHINIDINPSLDLGINLFYRVVSVEPLNDDGKKLITEMPDIKFAAYDEALRKILGNKSIEALLSEDEILTVTVISAVNANTVQSANILSAAKACVSSYGNVHCHSASLEDAEAAKELGLSYEKYLAYLNLRSIDQNITPEIIRNMTMREIRELITLLTGNEYTDFEHDNQDNHDDHSSQDSHDYQESHDEHSSQDSHDNHDSQDSHDNYLTSSESGHHGNGHKNGHD